MEKTEYTKRIAVIGGGPGSLFMYKCLTESGEKGLEVTIFEKNEHLGVGMPYSDEGANDEHVTNVSDNEIPELVTTMSEWIFTAPKELLERFAIDPVKFNEYKVVPRLLFGCYLEAQFELLQQKAHETGIKTIVHLNTKIIDIRDQPDKSTVLLESKEHDVAEYDAVIIATGHYWPKKHEGKVPGYYDSPYPPSKLRKQFNHTVALRGSSLTAIDAIRTLARNNGSFAENSAGKLAFIPSEESPDFKLIMHTRNGMLPAVRFHLDDSQLSSDSILTPEQISETRQKNNGFLPLDYVFEKNFKELFIEKDPDFYNRIKDMTIEEFVATMMDLRENLDPFELLRAEYAEAEKSIKRRQSVYWKEMLAVLSFAMNYPAKYFSAEDMLRLQKELMPLIAIVIAFIPQTSCRELMALNDAGKLEIVSVGSDGDVIVNQDKRIIYKYKLGNEDHSYEFQTFIDCRGQAHLSYYEFLFPGLKEQQVISPAKIRFQNSEAAKQLIADGDERVEAHENGEYYLRVSGIAINDCFQVINHFGAYNERIYIMAVPYIGGYNPDYSGLDFCEAASQKIADSIFRKN